MEENPLEVTFTVEQQEAAQRQHDKAARKLLHKNTTSEVESNTGGLDPEVNAASAAAAAMASTGRKQRAEATLELLRARNAGKTLSFEPEAETEFVSQAEAAFTQQ